MSTRLQRQSVDTKLSNAAVAPVMSGLLQRKCACGGSAGLNETCVECQHKKLLGQPLLQAKLHVNEPGDQYEQEADRLAERVMRMPAQARGVERSPSARTALVQRRTAESGMELGGVPSIVHDVLHSTGQPLDAATRAFMEPHFGHEFSQVRVHTDAKAAESAQAVNALAYTVGQDVVFGRGSYAPGAGEGRRLLAHELTHVVQQCGAEKGRANIQPVTVQRQTAQSSGNQPHTESEGCDPVLQNDLQAMHQPALDHVNRAIASLAPGWKSMIPADKAAFTQYFDPSGSGKIDDGFVSSVREKYQFIRSNMRSLRFDCDPGSWTLCGTSKRWCVWGRLMWTCFGNLHVCSDAYRTASGDSKIETIIHESVHNALLTTDRAYSNESGFRKLSPRGTGFWGRVLNFLGNIPVLGILFRLLPGNTDTINNPDSYAGYAMQV